MGASLCHTDVCIDSLSLTRKLGLDSLMLGLFGWVLVFRSAIGVLVSLLLLPPLVARMNSEEALLESEFGERYSDYRRRT